MEENTTLKSIGERIRIARKAKGLNQQQLADAIGKSIRAVQMYEKGETDLNISIMESLATALDMKLSDLISDNKSENLATLSDVIEFFIQLSKVKNVHYEIDVKKPPLHDEWECAVVFKGKILPQIMQISVWHLKLSKMNLLILIRMLSQLLILKTDLSIITSDSI